MAIITKISTQKNSAERYNVYINEKFAFGVDEEVLIKYQLKKGKELSELEITQIQYEDEIRKAYHQAIQYLSFRMRSKKEIVDHLTKKEWEPAVIEAVLSKLDDRQYTNDLEFAKAYVRTQVNAGKKGPQTIKQELKQKGVSSSHIEEALESYDLEQQIDHAIKQGNKLAKQHSRLSEKILKQKITQSLGVKGFSFDVISVAMEAIEYEKDDDEEWDALVKEGEKAKRRYKGETGFEWRQKIKQTLYRKGFTVDMIDRFLDEHSDDD